MFDWQEFLTSRHIDFRKAGLRHVEIPCPLCGSDDPGTHMAISLEGQGWKCWRRPREHYGRSPIRLVQLLLGCSLEQAQVLVTGRTFTPTDFLSRVRAQLSGEIPKATVTSLTLPAEIVSIKDLPSARPYTNYLRSRGFTLAAVRPWDLHYATRGDFHGRIIFPVRTGGELMTWTGRTISRREPMRYLTLGRRYARGPISDYLLWFDQLQICNADTIVLTEGPFDALKINTLGARYGICSTCFFTASASNRQIDLLHKLLPRFQYRYLLLDQGTLPTAMRLQAQLASLGVRVAQLPPECKDPCDLTENNFTKAKEQFRLVSSCFRTVKQISPMRSPGVPLGGPTPTELSRGNADASRSHATARVRCRPPDS